ncbi:hypothetical protein PCANC_05157 [Puccinia coronata f. sp. avenae]|uniref:Uncharacterized protein n=1 Tax=Puccinia coronata f. sp. avenae TaxID=200324 RepID=A0A2N5W311_9BASI|nr:hypothetical protein PCASD_07841 [Puccinia coronata f. sp. avenae]PLW56633.1 hypothetical protein PCANC_05157 [Puccinia coronata f. sp. avenae]
MGALYHHAKRDLRHVLITLLMICRMACGSLYLKEAPHELAIVDSGGVTENIHSEENDSIRSIGKASAELNRDHSTGSSSATQYFSAGSSSASPVHSAGSSSPARDQLAGSSSAFRDQLAGSSSAYTPADEERINKVGKIQRKKSKKNRKHKNPIARTRSSNQEDQSEKNRYQALLEVIKESLQSIKNHIRKLKAYSSDVNQAYIDQLSEIHSILEAIASEVDLYIELKGEQIESQMKIGSPNLSTAVSARAFDNLKHLMKLETIRAHEGEGSTIFDCELFIEVELNWVKCALETLTFLHQEKIVNNEDVKAIFQSQRALERLGWYISHFSNAESPSQSVKTKNYSYQVSAIRFETVLEHWYFENVRWLGEIIGMHTFHHQIILS